MTCTGCSGAIDRVLKKTDGAYLYRASGGSGWEVTGERGRTGVAEYDISLEKQEVLVKGTIPYDDLHAKIAKTGKQVGVLG